MALPLTAFATLIPTAPGDLGIDFFAARSMSDLGNSTSAAVTHAALGSVDIQFSQTTDATWATNEAKRCASLSRVEVRRKCLSVHKTLSLRLS